MTIRHLAGVAVLAAVVPATALAAPTHSAMSVQLHPTTAYKGKAAFGHVMASATVTYKAHDAVVTLSTDNLPRPSTLGARVYVLYATSGRMTTRVGPLHVKGAMAGVTGTVMMSRIQDLYVYALKSATMKHPLGKPVLAGMVG